MRATGIATDWETVDRFDGGVGWIAHPEEAMQRASHALAVDGEVWIVDPVDVEGLDELLAEYGDVAGVIVLLDRHSRDAETIAGRHDVPIYLPSPLRELAEEFEGDVQIVHRELDGTGYGLHTVVDTIGWTEVSLYGEDTGTLVFADALGTASYFLTGDERLGVHPMLRINPPRSLRRLSPGRILVGHGRGIHENAPEVLRHALSDARARAPRLYWETLRDAVGL